MIAAATALTGGFGLLIGSFLNVVIFRVPAGRSIVNPPSACGGCGNRIRPYDNVPVLSWLLLRGKCRDCSTSISARYPFVELLTGVAFVAVVLRFAPWEAFEISTLAGIGALAETLAFLVLAGIGIALAWIDLDTQRLPDAIVLPSYPVLAVLLGTAGLATGEYGDMLRAALGAAILWGGYLLMAFAYPRGMGLGDVKLAGVIGMALGWLGWPELAVGAFAAFLLGGAFAIILVLARRAGRGSGIPFGPWMLAGTAVAIFAGDPIWHGYLRLVGLE
ncbi:prepilin peptidase [Agrococcus baldri]|uniref:Prepilin leader peptidase/N-methyltransferase n=1 Tax=Agrococcus baldri TaxID=153730 RepID=A0AA87RMX8_9MICO|nr:A24 family peptidase [Agrococcus baldri]GEK80997.1 prepilin peptidase [Agrococcus baldri]